MLAEQRRKAQEEQQEAERLDRIYELCEDLASDIDYYIRTRETFDSRTPLDYR